MSQADPPPVAEPDDDPLPSCGCGTDSESRFCVKDREYSFLRTLYLLWGGTSVPTKVSFRCVKCGEVFEVATSPAVCRRYIK
ncbi:MAG TPA: hypothetical protein VHS09_11770 [Polyangiaceae bacterium]|jgi:hypothetical protein|nr:hypothetical protein [Polyangiaceae bacterium]